MSLLCICGRRWMQMVTLCFTVSQNQSTFADVCIQLMFCKCTLLIEYVEVIIFLHRPLRCWESASGPVDQRAAKTIYQVAVIGFAIQMCYTYAVCNMQYCGPQGLRPRFQIIFTVQCSYTSAVLWFCQSLSVRLSHACFVTKPNNGKIVSKMTCNVSSESLSPTWSFLVTMSVCTVWLLSLFLFAAIFRCVYHWCIW